MFNFLSANTADERLDELERFIEFWYGKRRATFGEPDVRSTHPTLPETLLRFYEFAGRWPVPGKGRNRDPFYGGAGGHHLLTPSQIRSRPDGRLRFFTEYQGEWAGFTLPNETDPPVWIEGYWYEPADDKLDDDEADEQPPKVKRVSEALSKFLVTHCLMTTGYEYDNSPEQRSTSFEVKPVLADWLRRDSSAVERLWEVEADCCPNYEGTFHLLQRHILVHETRRGFMQFGALHPDGINLLRRVTSADA